MGGNGVHSGPYSDKNKISPTFISTYCHFLDLQHNGDGIIYVKYFYKGKGVLQKIKICGFKK